MNYIGVEAENPISQFSSVVQNHIGMSMGMCIGMAILVKHNKLGLPEPQTLAKHDRSSLPEPESLIYSSNPAQIQLRSIRSPHEIQTQLKSIRAHFMPTQNRAICSHNLPRLSRSPLILSHDGSAAAAAAHKSAALSPLRGARYGVLKHGYSFRKLKQLPA